MAAIVHFTPAQAHDLALPVGAPGRSHRRTGPALRVLEGGRSPRSLARIYARRRVAALVLALVALVAVVALAVAALDLTGSALGRLGGPGRCGRRLGRPGAGGRSPATRCGASPGGSSPGAT